MRDRGFDITIAYYMPQAEGYSVDLAEDFSSRRRIVDMTDASGPRGVDRLERVVRELDVPLLLQIGAPQAYRQLPYLKERIPDLIMLDILYNSAGHTLNHFLYENAFEGVIVESKAMRDYVLASTAKQSTDVFLVESGIALDEFTPALSKGQRAGGSSLIFGYLGRMSPEKNPLAFVDIAERLHFHHSTLRFRMFGEGGMERDIRSRVAGSRIADAITFEGYAPHPRDALQGIDVLVVPSKLDGRPNVIMEANACGVPVLAAPVGGIPELIEEGVNGYVIRPEDHAEYARRVRDWLNDPASFACLRRSSRVKAERDFNRRDMLDKYAAVFADALK